ncbi:MAG: maleylpyruvate isomerase family mycothiol-dependent enzyme [Acidimicrobiales bacterium]
MRTAARLLLIEADALPPLLASVPAEHFDRPSPCDGWSVRDVLAHCSAALGSLVAGTMGGFTPEENQRDVDERSTWPLQAVIDDLVINYAEAAQRIDELGGAADGLGLGEWVHGGDVREPLGLPNAYCSAGIELALELLSDRSVQREAPPVEVVVDGAALSFGVGPSTGRLVTDTETLVRLVAGRRPDPARYELTGDVTPAALVLFR